MFKVRVRIAKSLIGSAIFVASISVFSELIFGGDIWHYGFAFSFVLLFTGCIVAMKSPSTAQR